MKKSLICLSCLLAATLGSSAFAQTETITHLTDTIMEDKPSVDILKVDTIEYISNPSQNYFFTLQAGLSHSMSENVRMGNFWKAERVSYIFSAGKFFYPQFGMRASLGWVNQASYVEETAKQYKLNASNGGINYKDYYHFSIAQLYVDGVIDLHSVLFGAKEKRRFNVYAFVGLGYLYTFNFDKQATYWNDLAKETQKYGDKGMPYRDPMGNHYYDKDGVLLDYNTDAPYAGGDPANRPQLLIGYGVNTKHRGYFAGHVGLWANYKVSDKWDVNFEASFNGTDDAYNGVRYRRVYDSYVGLLAGVTYHIPDPEGKRRYRYSHLTDADRVNVLNKTIVETQDSLEQAQVPQTQIIEHIVEYNEMLQTTVQFYIDRTFITEAQEKNVRSVAKFMENHPEINVVVTGYADVQTAYPAYNLSLSKKRAENVYDMLVNKYGIDPARLKKDWKGDQEQAFKIVNEWNRSVVFFIEKPKPVKTVISEEFEIPAGESPVEVTE